LTDKAKAIGLQDLVDGLLFSLQAEGKSTRTIGYYRDLLRPFLNYASQRRWPDDPTTLDAQNIRGFLSWIVFRCCEYAVGNGAKRVGKATPSTAWPYYRALRRLFNWAVEEGYMKSSPLANIRFKPPAESPVEGYTTEELQRLLAVCDLDIKRLLPVSPRVLMFCAIIVTSAVIIIVQNINHQPS